ncbi:hypothetical protein IG631_16951 [Alternaria alternata]|nr:hypothetical protein IG631_16951 [Alternaria alternata]
MADTVEESKQSISGEGNADANASVGAKGSAESSSKKTERKTPKKLGGKKPQQQPTPDATPAPESDGEGKAENEDAESKKQTNGGDADNESDAEPQQEKSKSQSRRRQSRGRGRRGADSGAESDARSDVSQSGGRRNRQRQKKGGKGGGPLDDITENVPGADALSGAGDMVQNTAGNAVNSVGDTAGKALGGLTGGGGEEEGGKDGGEQLRLRLELNLDIEIQLKAKIHGDLTLGLLCPSLNVGLTSVTSDAARSETVRRVGGTGVRACNGGCWRPCFWSYRGTQSVASNLVFGVESAGARSWRAWVCGNLRPLLLDLGLTSHLARCCFRTPQLSAVPLFSNNTLEPDIPPTTTQSLA